jgi:ribosomal-protein-serine acetyltransferase
VPDGSFGVLPDSIEIPDLVVRCWRESDVPDLADAVAANLGHLAPFMPWVSQEPLTDAARTQMVRDWEADRAAGGDALYGIWREGRVVGAIGAHRRVARDGLEIGYWLRAEEQGRGTMTRVVEGLTRALLALPGITHVEIRHDEANVRSAAIPPRCGYRCVGREQRVAQAEAGTGWGLVWRIGTDPDDTTTRGQLQRP